MHGTDATHCPLCIGSLIGPAQQALAGAHFYIPVIQVGVNSIQTTFFFESDRAKLEEETKAMQRCSRNFYNLMVLSWSFFLIFTALLERFVAFL